MGNYFSLVKFTNALDCNRVLEGQTWFVGGKIIAYSYGKTILHPVKEELQSVPLLIRLARLPMEI